MKYLVIVLLMLSIWINGCSQSGTSHDQQGRPVGGSCGDCEALFEYGSKKLTWIDTLPDYGDVGPKMEVSGTVYQRDGKTPAAGIILYVYHTNQEGVYPTKGDETGWAKRHGYIRGWIKTDESGKYKFYTLKPAGYPDGKNPAHIHATIKEPNVSAYWIDEYLFDDDPILTREERESQKKRGGNGILKLTKSSNGVLIAHRDIVLGLNIPGY